MTVAPCCYSCTRLVPIAIISGTFVLEASLALAVSIKEPSNPLTNKKGQLMAAAKNATAPDTETRLELYRQMHH